MNQIFPTYYSRDNSDRFCWQIFKLAFSQSNHSNLGGCMFPSGYFRIPPPFTHSSSSMVFSITENPLHNLNDLRVSQFGQLPSACIVIFEHLITLDEEINLIWPSSWTPVKILFLVNRYYALVAMSLNIYVLLGAPKLTDSVSTHYFKWQGWSELVFCILADGVLQIRLYALYSMDKRMLVLMLTFFTIAVSISVYILVSVLLKVKATAVYSPFGGMVCVPLNPTSSIYLLWVPLIIFECLLLALAVFRGLQTLKHSGSLGRKLVLIFMRDSVIYFLAICMTYAACLGVGISEPTLLGLPTVFAIALPCVLSNRLVLNVRASHQMLTTSVITRPVSTIKFR